jgi:hypothetical protein
VLQKVHDFFKILLGIFITSNIVKHYSLFVETVQFCLALTEAHRLTILPLRLTHHKHKEANDNQYWYQNNRQIPQRITSG